MGNYRKIPKISPGAYIFQRPFLRGLYSEGLIHGGKFPFQVNLPFLLCSTLYLRAIFQVQAPGGLYLEGRFNGGFFALRVWGAFIWRGLFLEFYGIPFCPAFCRCSKILGEAGKQEILQQMLRKF